MGRAISPIPFDKKGNKSKKGQQLAGLTIRAYGPGPFQHLSHMMDSVDDGRLTPEAFYQDLEKIVKSGFAEVEKNQADPFSRTRIVELPAKPVKGPTKSNPLSGKGKSYGKHVEDGWGQFVRPEPGDAGFDDLLDDIWNNGKF